MKVPLHRTDSISIARAALSLRTDQLGRELVRAANAGDADALSLVEGMRAGITAEFLDRLLALLKGFREIRTPHRPGNWRKVQWWLGYEYPKRPGKEWAYALVAIRLINADAANRLIRCESTRDVNGKREPCGKLFYGDPRSRWCSTTCGTRQRNFEARTGRGRS